MAFTIITWLFGLLGVGGIGLIALSSFGIGGPIIAGIVAWFVAKNIPWKLIAICAAAVLIALMVFGGYQTFKTTQSNLEQARVELAQQKQRAIAEKARGDLYQEQHDKQIVEIQQLERARSEVEEHSAELQQQIDNMNLEKEFANDAVKANAALNARSSELNRLLIESSRRPGAVNRSTTTRNKARKAK